jgi:hypothetical protein
MEFEPRRPEDHWRLIINGAIRVYMERVGKWPAGQKFLPGGDDVVEGIDLDPSIAVAAVNGDPLDGFRGPALWIIADATARCLNRHMHKKLRGLPEAIAIAKRQIHEELLAVAAHPLKWVYFSFPWGEPNSELNSPRRA